MPKQTSIILEEDEREALKELGDGEMVEGIRQLLRETNALEGKEGKGKKPILPETPTRRKAYEKLWRGGRTVEENVRVTDLGTVYGMLCPTLGMSKQALRNVLEDLIEEGFIKKDQGMKRTRVVIFRRYE